MVVRSRTIVALRDQLQSLRGEWNQVGAAYPDPDSVFEMRPDGSPDLSNSGYAVYCSTFADAWEVTLIPARQLFQLKFALWATHVVNVFGTDQFPMDCGEPPSSEHQSGQLNQESLAQYITGTNNTVDAGLRVIFWAVAGHSSAHYRSSYEFQLFYWVKKLIFAGNGRCRTYAEPFDWVEKALENLISTRKITRRFTLKEAETSVNQVINAWLKTSRKPSVRDLADKIGCSTGTVSNTDAWKAYQAGQNSKITRTLQAVSLTGPVEQSLGVNDPELEQLIKEQTKDLEDSPLVTSTTRRRSRRRKV